MAEPWFRIFNPVEQSRKFDPDGLFIRQYCPEIASLPDAALHAPWLAKPAVLEAANLCPWKDYPLPLVDHATQRLAALEMFKKCSQTLYLNTVDATSLPVPAFYFMNWWLYFHKTIRYLFT